MNGNHMKLLSSRMCGSQVVPLNNFVYSAIQSLDCDNLQAETTEESICKYNIMVSVKQ